MHYFCQEKAPLCAGTAEIAVLTRIYRLLDNPSHYIYNANRLVCILYVICIDLMLS